MTGQNDPEKWPKEASNALVQRRDRPRWRHQWDSPSWRWERRCSSVSWWSERFSPLYRLLWLSRSLHPQSPRLLQTVTLLEADTPHTHTRLFSLVRHRNAGDGQRSALMLLGYPALSSASSALAPTNFTRFAWFSSMSWGGGAKAHLYSHRAGPFYTGGCSTGQDWLVRSQLWQTQRKSHLKWAQPVDYDFYWKEKKTNP